MVTPRAHGAWHGAGAPSVMVEQTAKLGRYSPGESPRAPRQTAFLATGSACRKHFLLSETASGPTVCRQPVSR